MIELVSTEVDHTVQRLERMLFQSGPNDWESKA